MRPLRIAAVFIVSMFVLASCAGDEPSKPAAAKAPASPAEVVSARPASDSNSADDKRAGSSRLELQEGITTQSDADYVTATFSPRMTFHTPDLAYPFFTEVVSERGIFFGSQVGGLIVFRPSQIFDPSTGKPAPVPADLTGWVTDNEHVDAGPVQQVTVAGLHGSGVIGTVTSAIEKVGDCEQACIRLAPVTPKDSVWFVKGDRFRLTSVTYHGEAIGIVEVSDKSGFGQLTSAATKLLKTLEFH